MARTAKATGKHDAHVQAFIADAVATPDTIEPVLETVAEVVEEVVEPVVAPQEAPSAKPLQAQYQLAAKAAQDRATLQAGAKTGKGTGWRVVATAKPNTRLLALAAIANIGPKFTEFDVMFALGVIKAQLGSGTPRSYWKALTATGYIIAAEEEAEETEQGDA